MNSNSKFKTKFNSAVSYLKIIFISLKNFFLASVIIGSLVFSVFVATVLCYVFAVMNDPSQNRIPYDLREIKLDKTSHIYVSDENQEFQEYLSIHGIENRVQVNLDKIPRSMQDAIIAIEDKRFLKHAGVDFVRTFGAVFSLLSGRNSYGGSTITQQLVKNLSSDEDISLTRKVREFSRSLSLESDYSKDEILEAYSNVASFGSGTN